MKMTKTLLSLLLVTITCQAVATDVPEFPSTLDGHLTINPHTYLTAPKDAPYALNTSGRFTSKDNKRVEKLGAIANSTGISTPFAGQPLQGFSGIKTLGDNHFLLLTDNGFGSKRNSADAMLMFHIATLDFAGDQAAIDKTIFIKDPNRVIPFPIVTEHSESRYLTGADLDIESIQPVDGGYLIGDEFGPFLLKVDENGVVTKLYDTVINGKAYIGADNPYTDFSNPDKTFNVPRSGGYEGMAASPDAKKTYPLLEKPTVTDGVGDSINGIRYLTIFEFDVEKGEFTDKTYKYPLEEGATAIGDFNLIDESRGLVIERDNDQGDSDQSCEKQSKPCFEKPAKFKRIYLIDLAQTDENGMVKKLGYIDLLNIQDPNGVAKVGKREDKIFKFPYFTIENVDKIDDTHIIVGDDNNFPFTQGRDLNGPDLNEFILLDVGNFLQQQ